MGITMQSRWYHFQSFLLALKGTFAPWASLSAEMLLTNTKPSAIQDVPDLGTLGRQGLCSHFNSSPICGIGFWLGPSGRAVQSTPTVQCMQS